MTDYPPLPEYGDIAHLPSEVLDVWAEASAHEYLVDSLFLSNIGDPWSPYRLAITAGPQYHVDDLVKVVTGPFRGRWGRVVDVHDFRHTHKVGADNSDRCEWLISVRLLSLRDGEYVAFPPYSVPFEPYEIAPLWGADGGPGDWVKRGRVLRPLNWPRARQGTSEAS